MRRITDHLSVSFVVILFLAVIVSSGRLATTAAQDEEHFTYIPLAILIPSTTKLIPNGDFEEGRTIWTEFSKWSNPLILHDDDLPRGISPHAGSWAAWLGGDSNEEAYIEQSVFIQSYYAYLSYWYWLDWPFPCQGSTAAEATVSIDGTTVYQTDVCQDTDTGGWVKQVIDVQAFAGQTVKLRFQLVTKSSSFANVYLDDVALQNSP